MQMAVVALSCWTGTTSNQQAATRGIIKKRDKLELI